MHPEASQALRASKMMIHCTQKLLSELRPKVTDETPDDPFWSFHATLLRIEKRKCVLLTNDLTLYSMFMPGLKKPDFESFEYIFGQSLFKNLLHERIPQVQIEAVLSQCELLSYQKSKDRRVLGCMNDLTQQLEYIIWDSGGLESTDIWDLNSKLNRTILSPIGRKRPIEALKEKLEELSPVEFLH